MKDAPGKKPQAPPQKAEATNMNQAAEWARIRAQWAKEQAEKVQARADRFFTTSDELPLGQHLLLTTIAVFVVVFILWANLATLDEITRGIGRIVPSSEVQKLQSLEGGIVDAFMVKEGDEVKAGQPLIRMRNIQTSADLGANRSRYLGLVAKITRLKAEVEGSDVPPDFPEDVLKEAPESVREEMQAFTADRQSLLTQTQVLEQGLTQKKQEINEIQTRVNDLQDVLRLAKEQRSMLAPLVERGSAPKLELLQIDQQIKQHQTELNSAQNSLPRARSGVGEMQARIDQLKSAMKAQVQTELATATAEMNTIKQTLTALEDRNTRTEIRSPVNGTVKDIKVTTVGGVIPPGGELIEIVPRDDQLIIEASIRPSDIAFLRPGQNATAKITAYDFSIYGGLKGELVDISADTISNEKGETFYRVRVRTSQTYLMHRGQKLSIIPGMVASVDILTGKKTIMEYLMKPFIKTLDSAMHER